MKRLIAASAAILLLAGCSGTADASGPTASPGAVTPAPLTTEAAAAGDVFEFAGVTVVGKPGEAPAVALANDFPPADALMVADVYLGTGEPAAAGSTVTVNYTGLGQQSRTEFDSSWSRGAPITFSLNQVIPGWQQGMVGMKPGGRRVLIIPGALAYGPTGNPPVIGPDETLVFVVDLVAPTPGG